MTTPTPSVILLTLGVALSATPWCSAQPLAIQPPTATAPTNPTGGLERIEDPLPPIWDLPAYSGRALANQVNLGPSGQNIIGDAANEPSIAVDPLAPNRIVITYRQFDSISSNFRQGGYSVSRDGGRTWTARTIDPGVFRSDPVVRADEDGTLFWNSLAPDGEAFICHVFRSTDGGATWSPPVYAAGGDKLWLTVDRTNTIGRGNIYQYWSQNASAIGPYNFNRSTNGGLSFGSAVALPVPIRWGQLAVGPEGELYVFGSNGRFDLLKSTNAKDPAQTPTFISMSANGGVRLISSPVFSDSAGPNPGGLLGQANICVDTSNGPRRGWVYFLSSVRNAGDSLDVVFASSPDGGVNRTNPIRINTDPLAYNSWQWFGTMSIAPNGRLDVIWNDTSQSQNPRLSRLYYTSSSDGGLSWTTPTPQTGTWDSWIGWPNQNKIGDYYDMESDNLGVNIAFSATLTGGQDVYFLRIGPRDCNRDDIGDEAQIAAGTVRDCNENQIPDTCEIAAGTLADLNGNGIADICDCGNADFDGDGDTGTDADIEAFFACLGGNCCAACGTADFDGDGDSGTDLDIEAFFRVLGGGEC